jgi:uncharacterized phage-associated protein
VPTKSTANVHDLAAFVLKTRGEMSTMKLQKLVYYCQAWSLVWDEKPIFPEAIQAWSNGPVVYELYDEHRGRYTVSAWPKGDPSRLSEKQVTTATMVLDFYGDKDPQWLSDLTHMEKPWQQARHGMPDDLPSSATITLDSMLEYYSSIRSTRPA